MADFAFSAQHAPQAQQAPQPPTPPSRFLEVDGCFNFRDLGGYRTADGRTVAWRMLFRSDALHRITPGGAPAFRDLKLASVLDLRSPAEIDEGHWDPPADWPGHWRNLPLIAEFPDWSALTPAERADEHLAAEHYLEIVHSEFGAAALREALDLLAEADALPAVFHCAAGKDRTGILAALLLRLLGVPADTVAEDYALSALATDRWAAAEFGFTTPEEMEAAWGNTPDTLRTPQRATMVTFLQRIDSAHGSVRGLLDLLGVNPAVIDRLRARLLV